MANVEYLTYDIRDNALWIGLNRVDKHNAFNEQLIAELEQVILAGLDNPAVAAFCLYAHGHTFSAGADLQWMLDAHRMNEAQNVAHAKRLADLLLIWHQSPKPTLCLVQGNAFGGALGFMAASDICLANIDARFCFSEVKLGLIPAIISPYILETIGLKNTKKLFMSAETFDAKAALAYGLLDEISQASELENRARDILAMWLKHPCIALQSIKPWLNQIKNQAIDSALIEKSAQELAKMRISSDAKERLDAFLAQKQGKA